MISANDIINFLGLRNARVMRTELICSCPFTENHRNGDSHPSFGINIENGLWNCFSCHESGNLPMLFERILGVTRFEAYRMVYPDMTVEQAVGLMQQDISGRGYRVLSPIEADVDRWSKGDRSYWYGRGFVDAAIDKWHLGYDAESNRAVVPVYYKNELVGWSKRRVNESDTPKWQHSAGFNKSLMLYGIDEREGEACILVEAPLSVVKMWQYGYRDVVASFGCNLSDRQASMIRNNYNRALIMYDPDDAGRRGTIDAIAKLSKYVDTYVVVNAVDDPAAMSAEQVVDALSNVVPHWMIRRG